MDEKEENIRVCSADLYTRRIVASDGQDASPCRMRPINRAAECCSSLSWRGLLLLRHVVRPDRIGKNA